MVEKVGLSLFSRMKACIIIEGRTFGHLLRPKYHKLMQIGSDNDDSHLLINHR